MGRRKHRKPETEGTPLGLMTERSAKAIADMSLEVGERLNIVMSEMLPQEHLARFRPAIDRAGSMLEDITPLVMGMTTPPVCGLYAQTPPGNMTVVIAGAANGFVAAIPLDCIDECIAIGRTWLEENHDGEPLDIPPLIALLLSKPDEEREINDAVSGVLLDLRPEQLALARTMARSGVTPVFLALLTSDERTALRFVMSHAWTMPVAEAAEQGLGLDALA